MNRQQSKPTDPLQNIDLRMRTLRTLWFGLVLSVPMYFVFTIFIGRREGVTPNNAVSLVLMGVSLSIALLSFFIKNKLLTHAIDQQRVPLVQQAYVATWAIAEIPALLGVLDFLFTGNRYYYLLMIMAVVLQLIHFPRREQVENASLKRSSF
jgi:predicted permease